MALRHSHISAETTSRAPRAFSRRSRDRRHDGARLVVGVADELGDRPRVERARRAGDRSRARRAACGRRGRCRRSRPRAAGAPRRRGCGPCRRRARRSGRSSTATRRCGRASVSPPHAAVAAVAAGWWSARGPARRRASSAGATAASPFSPSSRSASVARPAASTQVSLLPPPWLELTTRLPSGSATRVRPPGSTNTLSPSLTANGRRSTCRGTSLSSTLVGTVDSCTTGCAIQPRGSSRIALRAFCSWRALAFGPNRIP